MISMSKKKPTSYVLDALQERAKFFIVAGEDSLEGQIVSISAEESNGVANIIKKKTLATSVHSIQSRRSC
ncbi:MAG: hypothetical protein HUJ51_00520 [Eggerthellaceae bacterium]|nr:hypothetical protein [Eggerthellaceae bacterium]